MSIEIINEVATAENPKRELRNDDVKFVPGERWKNKDRYFIIDVVVWSSLGYIKFVGLLELSTRVTKMISYADMKRWTENGTMKEWKPERKY